MTSPASIARAGMPAARAASTRRTVIGLIAFLTLVDLFATQAILPALATRYGVTAGMMGVAANASTIGMAIASLSVGLFGRAIDPRRGVTVCLAGLAVPTLMLAVAPDLKVFALLRIAQGLAMAGAFALTLRYLAEHTSGKEAAAAFAAYVTGNVASNLFGRLMSATLADSVGLAGNFQIFAALNLSGAVLAWWSLQPSMMAGMPASRSEAFQGLRDALGDPALRGAFAAGFLLLFAFIGVFTYVNFVLARPPIGLAPMMLGVVYLVFAPSLFTTPQAGWLVQRLGTSMAFRVSIGLALLGTAFLVLPWVASVIVGLAFVGVGTFLAQAMATGFVGRRAAGAGGLYLASYFSGGLVGAAAVGQLFDHFGWSAAVAAVALALLAAGALSARMHEPRPA